MQALKTSKYTYADYLVRAIFPKSCSDDAGSSEQNAEFADVIGVEVAGRPGAYRFSVTIASPDTGCDQYADWWELLSENGELIHRRILLHSHVNEQPFTRSGTEIDIPEKQIVFVRAHMNNAGYGGQVMKGTITDGFVAVNLTEAFAPEVENEEPLPERCAF